MTETRQKDPGQGAPNLFTEDNKQLYLASLGEVEQIGEPQEQLALRITADLRSKLDEPVPEASDSPDQKETVDDSAGIIPKSSAEKKILVETGAHRRVLNADDTKKGSQRRAVLRSYDQVVSFYKDAEQTMRILNQARVDTGEGFTADAGLIIQNPEVQEALARFLFDKERAAKSAWPKKNEKAYQVSNAFWHGAIKSAVDHAPAVLAELLNADFEVEHKRMLHWGREKTWIETTRQVQKALVGKPAVEQALEKKIPVLVEEDSPPAVDPSTKSEDEGRLPWRAYEIEGLGNIPVVPTQTEVMPVEPRAKPVLPEPLFDAKPLEVKKIKKKGRRSFTKQGLSPDELRGADEPPDHVPDARRLRNP